MSIDITRHLLNVLLCWRHHFSPTHRRTHWNENELQLCCVSLLYFARSFRFQVYIKSNNYLVESVLKTSNSNEFRAHYSHWFFGKSKNFYEKMKGARCLLNLRHIVYGNQIGWLNAYNAIIDARLHHNQHQVTLTSLNNCHSWNKLKLRWKWWKLTVILEMGKIRK